METGNTFQAGHTYQIGIVAPDSPRSDTNNNIISLTRPPVSYSGNLILSKGVKTPEDFFKKNPFNMSKRYIYTIFRFDSSGARHWFGEGVMLRSKTLNKVRASSTPSPLNGYVETQGRIDSSMFEKNEEFYQDKINSLENHISRLQVDLSESKGKVSLLESDLKLVEVELQELTAKHSELELEAKERQVEDRITQSLSDKFEKEYLERAKEYKKEQESGMGDLGNMLMPLAQTLLPGLMAKLFGGEAPQVPIPTEQGFQDIPPQQKQQVKQPIDLGLEDD